MKAGIYYSPNDIRVENVPDPKLKNPTEAIIKVKYACICGSDLWSYRGIASKDKGQRIGHEFLGEVVETGSKVKKIKVGDLVLAPFWYCCGVCPECKNGISSSCRNGGAWGGNGYDGGQGEMIRAPFADSCLFVIPKGQTSEKMLKSILPLTDVMCTGHHAAVSAGVEKGKTVVVVGDGAVGLCAVLASQRLKAKKIILISTHPDRARIGRKFGATKIISARGEQAIKQVKKLTLDAGADCVLECVGTKESWEDSQQMVRAGGMVGFVGVPQGVPGISVRDLFSRNFGVKGGRAPAADYIPELLKDVLSGKLDPSPIFTKEITIDQLAEGYKAMDKREAIKVLIKF